MFLSLWFFIISKLKAKHILVVFTSMFSRLRCFQWGPLFLHIKSSQRLWLRCSRMRKESTSCFLATEHGRAKSRALFLPKFLTNFLVWLLRSCQQTKDTEHILEGELGNLCNKLAFNFLPCHAQQLKRFVFQLDTNLCELFAGLLKCKWARYMNSYIDF